MLSNHKAVFGLGSLETPVVSRTGTSALGRVYHLDRTLDGYPVWGRQLVVSESNARVRSVTGKMQPLPPLDTEQSLVRPRRCKSPSRHCRLVWNAC